MEVEFLKGWVFDDSCEQLRLIHGHCDIYENDIYDHENRCLAVIYPSTDKYVFIPVAALKKFVQEYESKYKVIL